MMLFRLANHLYSGCYPLYYRLYTRWKAFADRRERYIVRSIIKPDARVIDVGANIGAYTRFFSELIGSCGFVTALEPDPVNFKRLLENVGGLANVKAVHAAAGETSGEVALFKSNEMNVDHRTFDSGDGRESIVVRMVALDDLVAANERVDFIKLDVQGFEMSVLTGAQRVLTENRDIKILMEFWPYGLQKASVAPESVLIYLKSLGFSIAAITSLDEEFVASKLDFSSANSYSNVLIYRK
ncbi:FkbM family methyltransferase [Rhizobium mesosinicum]|uniref:FkbM family methyltransferase n=1 Tax=Rhizobium mesosinicum TaxID=335017 RepID=A0ABS7H2X9_9HYPH|nr:FkbM family methyltransferase [Rhizobium mesosinicum]MBW9056658.1 FkbM family methyltransferase [Rhizobium mesosinicum]